MIDGQEGGKIRLLAVASGGGHWEELMLLRPALEAFDVDFATTNPELAVRDGLERIHTLPDSNRHRPFRSVQCFWRALQVVRATRPDVVVTTGALPGLLCGIAGLTIGAKTIWIDSIANSERMSMSGMCARWFSVLWLTQWEHLERPSGPRFLGALL